MRRILLLIFWQFGLLAGGRLFADIVTMKDGRQISGVVESGNIQELHIKVGDQSQTIDIHQVQAIQFGVSLSAPPPPKAAHLAPEPAPAAARPALKAGAPTRAPQPPTSAPAGTATFGIGAEIAVRTADSTASRKASLDDPSTLDGVEVAPANANAFLPVTEVNSTGLTRGGKVETGGTGTVTSAGVATGVAAGGEAAAIPAGAGALTQPAFINCMRGRQ